VSLFLQRCDEVEWEPNLGVAQIIMFAQMDSGASTEAPRPRQVVWRSRSFDKSSR
jgi:hypothetical protein